MPAPSRPGLMALNGTWCFSKRVPARFEVMNSASPYFGAPAGRIVLPQESSARSEGKG